MAEVELTHLDAAGRPRMVDVGAKPDTERVATAVGEIRMQPATLTAIRGAGVAKGDVLNVAQTAAIMGAKRTWELIPMCHPLLLTGVSVAFEIDEDRSALGIVVTVKTSGKTGVEMEALTGVMAGLLTVYDMCKAIDRAMEISAVRLEHKSSGRSGSYTRTSP